MSRKDKSIGDCLQLGELERNEELLLMSTVFFSGVMKIF